MRRRVRSKRKGPIRVWVGALAACGWMLGFVSSLPSDASAQMLTVEEAVALVRSIHFEGLPEERAALVGPEAASHLIEMLEDPVESAAHANILLVLGLCGQPGTFDAIDEWASVEREGEIGRDAFRAWQALPYAFGYASRHDRRAIARLEANFDAGDPGWTFRHHRGARLVRQSRRASATALAMTGLPEAAAALDRASRNLTDADFERHLRGARELLRQRAGARHSE